ncbi:hypothetical protein D3C72_2175620 [compost metagenome]
MAAQFAQQVAPHAVEQVIVAERRVVLDGIDQHQGGGRSLGHGHGHGPVKLDHRRRCYPGQGGVERGNPGPVGIGSLAGAGMAGGDC